MSDINDVNTPRFQIVYEEMGGLIRVFLRRGEPTGEVGRFLSQSLTDWMCKHPHLRVRFVVPISRDGDTSELHAWYDRVLFPVAGPIANPNADKA